MPKPPKDMILSLYSFKISSGSSDSLLPVVVSDIVLSKQRCRCSINIPVHLEEFLAEKKNPSFVVVTQKDRDLQHLPFSSVITEFVLPIFSSASHVADCVSCSQSCWGDTSTAENSSLPEVCRGYLTSRSRGQKPAHAGIILITNKSHHHYARLVWLTDGGCSRQ